MKVFGRYGALDSKERIDLGRDTPELTDRPDGRIVERPQDADLLFEIRIWCPAKKRQDLAVGVRLNMPRADKHHGKQMPDRSRLLGPYGRPDSGVPGEPTTQDGRRITGLAPQNIGIVIPDAHRRKRFSECLVAEEVECYI